MDAVELTDTAERLLKLMYVAHFGLRPPRGSSSNDFAASVLGVEPDAIEPALSELRLHGLVSPLRKL